jgi:hypothetical protein
MVRIGPNIPADIEGYFAPVDVVMKLSEFIFSIDIILKPKISYPKQSSTPYPRQGE